MNKSFCRSPKAGLYRSRCCRHLVPMVAGKILPLCPRCRGEAEWEQVVTRPREATAANRSLTSDAA